MKRVNRILILFLFVIMTSLFGIWEFLQSEVFANSIAKTVTNYTKEQLQIDLDFERIRFQLFPIGAIIENVKIKSNRKEILGHANVSELGVYFNLLHSFKTKLTIDIISLNDGVVAIDKLDNTKTKKKRVKRTKVSSDSKSIKKIETIQEISDYVLNKLPFKIMNLSLNKINSRYLDESININSAEVSVREGRIYLRSTLRGFNLKGITNIDEVINELKLDAIISDDEIEIRNVLVQKNLNSVQISGLVKSYIDLEKINYNIKGRIQGFAPEFHKYFEFKDIGEIYKGVLDVHYTAKGIGNKFDISTDITLSDFDSEFVYADTAKIKAEMNQDRILWNEFTLKSDEESINLEKPFEFYNFISNKFIEDNIILTAKDLKIKNALRYFKDVFSPVKGKINGEIRFVLNEKDYHFIPKDGFYISDFKLQFPEQDGLLANDKLTIRNGSFDINGDDFETKLEVSAKESSFALEGSIKDGEILFSAPSAFISLEEFGPFAGLKLLGKGTADISIIGNKDENTITLNNNILNFEFEGFKVDKLKSTVIIDINKETIFFNNTDAITGQTITKASGYVNTGNLDVKAKVSHEKILYSDLKRMYGPLLNDMKFIPDNISGEWKTNYIVSGKVPIPELIIKGSFSGKNNYMFGEGFDYFKFNYSLNDSKLSLDNLEAKKATGKLYGGYQYNLKNDSMIFWGNLSSIPLVEITNYNSLPLNLNGKLDGLIKGKIVNDKLSLNSELYISNSSVFNRKLHDSYAKFDLKDDKFKFKLAGIGDDLIADGLIDLAENTQKNNSYLSWSTTLEDLNSFLGVFSVVDILNSKLSGSLYANGRSEFNLKDLSKSTTVVSVNKLKIQKTPIFVDYNDIEGKQIRIKNGLIENWDLVIRGKNASLISKGKGDISSIYNISTRTKIDASILEVFNVLISKADGSLQGKIHNFNNGIKEDYVAKLVSNDFSLSSKFFPMKISKGDLLVTYKDSIIKLNRLKAQLNSGGFSLDGDINLSRGIPDINLKYKFDEAGISLFKKSDLVFSGKGSLVGNSVPYNLAGQFIINKCNIINEITDFGGDGKLVQEEIDFLPENTSKGLENYLNFNITVNTFDPIRITNSMADIGFMGNLQLTGGERDPHLEGKISLAPMINKVKFKNNEFVLSKGNIFFYERNEIFNPELDFMAASTINDYKLYVKLLGPVDKFKLNLTSEPSLPQADILSLIAFGYTEDLSTNLTDAQKESLTKAGVGSIIFDSFKINETLKNEFGIQVNLGTEISQDESSYLSRAKGETSTVGKSRSATKVEVTKQLSSAIDLSVSSTVGGSVGQKQSMNLNYNINKSLSFEGVYESNSDTDSEEALNESSVGADLKIRWSFK